LKFLEGHLTQEKDDGPNWKETHNRLGLLVETFQKQEERNDIGRQFLNISHPSVTPPLQLPILRGKLLFRYEAATVSVNIRPRWHSVPPAKVLVRGHLGVYHLL